MRRLKQSFVVVRVLQTALVWEVLFGLHFLDEGHAKRRLFAAFAMVVGLVALALGKPPTL